MKLCTRLNAAIGLLLFGSPIHAQTFVGTNSPGAGSDFTFSVPAGATNLSLSLSNTAASWSYLLLKRGAPPTDTDFDFISRLDGAANQLNVEPPEFVDATNYGLRVLTPLGSAEHGFSVGLRTNQTGLRSAASPVLKTLVCSTSGALSNVPGGSWHYFQVDVPTNLATGWRIVLNATGTGNPDLYARRGALPTQYNYDKASANQPTDTLTLTPAQATTNTWFIGVYLPEGAPGSTEYTLSTDLNGLHDLSWDSGASCSGNAWFTNASLSGGDYYFRLRPQTATNGAWRTFLQVTRR